jgi:hypothetical protein
MPDSIWDHFVKKSDFPKRGKNDPFLGGPEFGPKPIIFGFLAIGSGRGVGGRLSEGPPPPRDPPIAGPAPPKGSPPPREEGDLNKGLRGE